MRWNPSLDIRLSSICRDDRCDREDEHPYHEIVDTKQTLRKRHRRLGWCVHPFEPSVAPLYVSQAYESPHVLDSCVIEVCSTAIPKSKGQIQTDLTHVYGTVCDRRLFRSLARLARSGELLRFDLRAYTRGGSLNAYLLPGGAIRLDPRRMYEILSDQFDSCAIGRGGSGHRIGARE